MDQICQRQVDHEDRRFGVLPGERQAVVWAVLTGLLWTGSGVTGCTWCVCRAPRAPWRWGEAPEWRPADRNRCTSSQYFVPSWSGCVHMARRSWPQAPPTCQSQSFGLTPVPKIPERDPKKDGLKWRSSSFERRQTVMWSVVVWIQQMRSKWACNCATGFRTVQLSRLFLSFCPFR